MHIPKWVFPVLLGTVILGLWILSGVLYPANSYALPQPQSVVKRLYDGIAAGYLVSALSQTLRESLLGCCLAALVSIPLGILIARFRFVSAAVEPYLAASQAIPAVAVAPLLVIWIGYGTLPIVVLCAIIVSFPIVINTAVGIRSIDADIVEAARLDGADGIKLLVYLEIPLASPSVLAGLRNGFTLAVTGAVVGEMVIGGNDGMGIRLMSFQQTGDTAGMFSCIALLAAAAVGIYSVLRFLENRSVKSVSKN